MFKLMIVGRRRGGMTVAQLHRYMIESHGAGVVRCIGTHPDDTPRRYVQNHVFDASFRVPRAEADPFSVARDFVTQVWFDNSEQARAAVRSQIYLDELQPDEDRFVDQASVVKLAVDERRVQGHRTPGASSKLFVFLRAAPGSAAPEFDAATLHLWQPLLDDAASGVAELRRNTVLGSPDGPPTVDLVDEVWVADDAAARRLGDRWQALADGPELARLTPAGSTFVLLAREKILFAGAAPQP